MSKVIKFHEGHQQSHRKESQLSARQVADSLKQEFFPYESICQMTDGSSTDTDAAMLEKIKDQYEIVLRKSKEIVNKAQADAARIEQEAYQKGFEQGLKDGEDVGRQKNDEVVLQFSQLFQEVQRKAIHVDQVYQRNILELVKVMADRLVDHEIQINPGVIRFCLEKALDFVVKNSRVVIRLNPADYRNITESGQDVPGVNVGDSRLQLVQDATISAGGCLLSTDYGEVDATREGRSEILYEVVERAFTEALSDTSSVEHEDVQDDQLI